MAVVHAIAEITRGLNGGVNAYPNRSLWLALTVQRNARATHQAYRESGFGHRPMQNLAAAPTGRRPKTFTDADLWYIGRNGCLWGSSDLTDELLSLLIVHLLMIGLSLLDCCRR